MKYELNRLGADNFEALIQSLVRGIAGIPTLVFGDGPDGQREAVVENAVLTINNGITTSGRTVVQAKYKSPDGKDEDWSWLRKNLKSELDGFRKKLKTDPQIIPNTFLFFTNIVLTPVLNVGVRDRAELFVEEYKDVVPNIHILGADDIRTLLENNRDVAKCYAGFIMSGDVLTETIDALNSIQKQKFENLIEYAHQMFREDCAVRLEQAGSVDNKSINIRNVYIDLEARTLQGPKRKINEIASYIINLGNRIHIRTSKEKMIGKPELISHDDCAPEYNIVLIGNAGQGKSTLCQYICQIYRAALIKRFRSTVPDIQSYYIDDSNPIPSCERFPVLVNLRRYAAWVNKQENESNRSVLSYILMLINGKTGASLSVHELREFFSSFSWLFVFDGLDEVPVSANRSEVLRQIQDFLNKDLVESYCDSLVICTSRPQGYDNAFSERAYSHYELQNMSKPLCKRYIERLLLNLEDNGEIREQYSNILSKALNDPMVSKLMTTPLYAAIIVLLVKMGGSPPSKRYALFHEYCGIVIKREQQKGMLPSINDDFVWITALHSQIGFLLQTESESRENAAAELSSLRFKEIIEKYLLDAGIEDNIREETNRLYQAVTKRLTFISEVNGEEYEDSIVFPLRSIQEYFAAEWLISFDDENKLSEALEIISVCSYWRNVYLFVSGYFTKNLNRKNINEALFRICQRNNGDINFVNPDAEETTVWRIGQHGSRLALEMLCENLFTRPMDVQRYLNLSAELLNDNDGDVRRLTQNFLKLPDRISEKFLREKVIPHIYDNRKTNSIAFFYLWVRANEGNEFAAAQLESLINIVETPDSGTVRTLLSYGFTKISKNVIGKVFEWVTDIHFSGFCLPFWEENTYWSFMSCYYRHFPERELSISVIRQIVYIALRERPKKQDSCDVEFVTHKSASLSEFLLAEHELGLSYGRDSTERGLRVKSIKIDLRNFPFVKYKELFQVNQLKELVSLIEYLERPSNTTLRQLLIACNDLPEEHKGIFLSIMSSCNWLLMEIAALMRQSQHIESILEKYDDFFADSGKEDEEIVALAIEGNICEITRYDYWDRITCGYVAAFPEHEVLDSVRIVSNKTISDGFINFIVAATKAWRTFPDELKKFLLKNYSAMFSHGEGAELALNLFDMLSLGELITNELQYPQRPPNFWLYPDEEDDQAKRILDKIVYIAKLGGKYLNVYALVPHLSGRLASGKVEESIDDIRNLFFSIKETGNPMALFGYVLCILCGTVTPEIKGIIGEDLIKMLQDENTYLNWYTTVDAFSSSGKLFVYEKLQAISYEEPKIRPLLATYSRSIQTETEAKSIDKNTLIELSESAHGY